MAENYKDELRNKILSKLRDRNLNEKILDNIVEIKWANQRDPGTFNTKRRFALIFEIDGIRDCAIGYDFDEVSDEFINSATK